MAINECMWSWLLDIGRLKSGYGERVGCSSQEARGVVDRKVGRGSEQERMAAAVRKSSKERIRIGTKV